jgi:predicted unusual protein kinase regulating ubiquinone biosynthesis (AarF/ABC1/UbiB family)
VQTIVEVIQEDLEAPPDKIFADFDQAPLGSASIGRVHGARLFDGRDVVVKVRNPGVDELVQIDLAILASLVEDRALVATEVDRMLQRYVNVSLKSVHVGDALGELLRLGRRYSLRLPGNLVQFFKTLAMSEGLLLKIYPESSFADYLRPMAGKLILQGYVGPQGADHLRDSALDLVELAGDLPRRLDRVLNEIELGNLRICTRIEDLEPLVLSNGRRLGRTPQCLLPHASWG